MKLNLPNLFTVLKCTLNQIQYQGISNANLLVCYGNAASGKSTILNSLIHGCHSLQLVSKEDQSIIVNPKQ